MRARCATSGLIVDLTFDLDAVTLTSEKLVWLISQRVLSVAGSNLVYWFLMRGWCAISVSVVNLTFDLVTVTLTSNILVGQKVISTSTDSSCSKFDIYILY